MESNQLDGNIVETSSCRYCDVKKTVFEHFSGNVFPYEDYDFTGEEVVWEGEPVICSICQVKRRAM